MPRVIDTESPAYGDYLRNAELYRQSANLPYTRSLSPPKAPKIEIGVSRGGGPSRADKLIAEYKAAVEKANLANIKRYEQGLGIYANLIGRYQPGAPISGTEQSARDLLRQNISTFEPGGTFGQTARSQYDVGATQSRAAAFQNLVSSGMSNVTGSFDRQASIDRGRFGLNLEERRAGLETGARGELSRSLTQAESARRLALERSTTGKIGFIERREDVAPDFNLMANLLQQG